MKKWLTVSIVLVFVGATLLSGIVLLTGNSYSQAEEITPTVTPSPRVISNLQLSATEPARSEEYTSFVEEYTNQREACDSDGAAFFVSIQKAKEDSSLMLDESFLTQLMEELDTFEQYCTNFGRDEVPEELETINGYLQSANQAYSQFAEDFRTGIQELNQDYIDEAEEQLQAGNQYITLANDEIQN